jgi:Na+-transporting methylmalonyl-CoA/oxaloacetate decarboxylase gamma subunit
VRLDQGFILFGETGEPGTVSVEIKYGNDPDFLHSRGFSLRSDIAVDDSEQRRLSGSEPIRVPAVVAYNGNATLQVGYKVNQGNPPRVFFQCVDFTLVGGKPLPPGDFPKGFGPVELTGPVIQEGNRVGAGVPSLEEGREGGLSTLEIVLICLGVAAVLMFLIVMYCFKKNSGKVEETPPEPTIEEKIKTMVPEEKHESPTEEEKTDEGDLEAGDSDGTESTNTDENLVARLHFTMGKNDVPVDREEKQTDESDRHFHFRYIAGQTQPSPAH